MSVSVTGWRSAEKEDLLARKLSVVERPAGVGEPDILIGTDHDGDAAVHILYPVSKKFKPTTQRIKALANFAEAVHSQLRTLELDIIPYVRFREADI